MEEKAMAIEPENIQPDPVTPANLLQIAVSQGADLEKLSRLMDLQERYEANEARKQYVAAMAAFKLNPPEILKDTRVSYSTSKGQTEYSHASLGNVTNTISAGLSKHGLSAGWSTGQQDDKITVRCTVTHSAGHSESTSLSAVADTSGGKNAIQAIGSTISYLERYTLLAITGLATQDMDNDGQSVIEYISEEQANELDSMIKENINSDPTYTDKLCKYLKITTITELPTKKFNMAKMAIQSAIDGLKKGAE